MDDEAAIQAAVFQVKKEARALRTHIDGLRADMPRVWSDVMDRVESLLSSIDGLKSEVTMSFGPARRTEMMARQAAAEIAAVSDQIIAVQAQVRRISAKVFGPDDLH